jgi:mRNA-degrading endonuclease RelE of RelBE toxin-antitoxin system
MPRVCLPLRAGPPPAGYGAGLAGAAAGSRSQQGENKRMAKTPYTIDYAQGVSEDLANLRAYELKNILDAIDKQLLHEPTRQTKNRKILVGLIPPWEHVPPVWELRIGEYRIFYDVDEETSTVTIRAVRHKPPHQTTEEIL